MNVATPDDSMENIFSLLDEKPSSSYLDLHIDENIFMIKNKILEEEDLSTSVGDNTLFSSIERPVVHPSVEVKIKRSTVSKINMSQRTKLPFMHRLYNYCSDSKNREWIDFYSKGGVHIKNIKKMSEDCLISPLLKIKFTSFRKMLTNYGFQSIKERFVENEVIYKNPLFMRGEYEQCLSILPTPEKMTNKKSKKRDFSDTSSETSDEVWVPPRKNLCRFNNKEETEFVSGESIPLLISEIMKKINKIEEDFTSFSISRTKIRKYQNKLKMIQELLNES